MVTFSLEYYIFHINNNRIAFSSRRFYMEFIIKSIKVILTIILALILIFIALLKLNPRKNINNHNLDIGEMARITPFNLNEKEITYNSNEYNNESQSPSPNTNTNNTVSTERKAILDRAQAMVEVKWTPKYNMTDKHGAYTFVKGKTYNGIPYSMDSYQVRAASEFLSKINGSQRIYGNDCSGFVSAAWGISRQTTLTFYEAVKRGKKIDGKSVGEISWDALKPGDAILHDDGKGEGHIVLFIAIDSKDNDKIYVYEQNVSTMVPFQPLPVARKDIRSKATLKKEGYFPIRLMTLD